MAFATNEALFDEVLDFLASSPSAEQIVDYQPPSALQQRLSELLDKNRTVGLNQAEGACIVTMMALADNVSPQLQLGRICHFKYRRCYR